MEKIVGVDFITTAEDELSDAVQWYNEHREGLGFEFAAEVAKTIDRIVRHPQACSALSKRTRRCPTHRFPYAVIYQIRKDRVLVVSIVHMKREPRSWRKGEWRG